MSTDIQIFIPDKRFSPEQESQLREPLKVERIHYRKGPRGMQLKYIKGDDAISVANELFGFGMWGYRIVDRSHSVVEDRQRGFPMDVYTCDIELHVVGSTFPFPGDGVGIVNDPFTAEMHEMARKAATTDALKRALRHYGAQFGLPLYDEDGLIDVGDGVLERVRNVKPDRSPGPRNDPRQVIIDQPPDGTIRATTKALYDAAFKLKQRAIHQKLIGNDEDWQELLTVLGIEQFAGGSDLAKVNGKLAELERKAS
jgi:hypothetical protein